MNLDEMCEEARRRLEAKTQERIDAFRQLIEREAEHTRRSFGQKWRRLREELLRGP